MSSETTIALFAAGGVRLGDSVGMRTCARRPSTQTPGIRAPAAVGAGGSADVERTMRFAARAGLTAAFRAPVYAWHEGRPRPGRTTAWITKPIDQDSRDTA